MKAQDIRTSIVWIPEVASIPQKDLHITICIPSLWRVPGDDDVSYNESVASALAEASMKHTAFQVEVDRLALGKDGSLLALFRTVAVPPHASAMGDYAAAELYDRGSDMPDPMAGLRADIIGAFFARSLARCQRVSEARSCPHRLLRRATIVKTVGGSVHGYIHCSLCRLAIAPHQTLKEVDLQELLHVVRSWSARLSGRRMYVNRFRLSEMTFSGTGQGMGGNKNSFDCSVWDRDIALNVPRSRSHGDSGCFSFFRGLLRR